MASNKLYTTIYGLLDCSGMRFITYDAMGDKIGPKYGQYRVLPTLVEFLLMKT